MAFHLEKYFKLDYLRRSSLHRRQRTCLTRALADRVAVRSTKDGAFYSGFRMCGFRSCPVCGPRLAAANRSEIIQCIDAWVRGEGGTVLFGTYTLQHSKGDSFEDLARARSIAWHAATDGRGFARDRRVHGVSHWLRVFEEKASEANGWHLHTHYLVFVRPGFDVEARDLLDSMFLRYQNAVRRLGMKVPLLRGQDLQHVDGATAAEKLGDYFSKQAVGGDGPTAESLGFELTNRDGKFSAVSLTPGELLTLAAGGSPAHAKLWREYEAGMKGRRVIAFSRGLRELAGVGDELADIDRAQLDEAADSVLELELRGRDAMNFVYKDGMRAELIRRVVENGAASAVAWLSEYFVHAAVGGFDVQGSTERDDSKLRDYSDLVVPF